MDEPVTIDETSEAKNLTAPIISSTSPNLRSFIFDSIHFTLSGSLNVDSVKGVLIKVRQIEFILILVSEIKFSI